MRYGPYEVWTLSRVRRYEVLTLSAVRGSP